MFTEVQQVQLQGAVEALFADQAVPEVLQALETHARTLLGSSARVSDKEGEEPSIPLLPTGFYLQHDGTQPVLAALLGQLACQALQLGHLRMKERRNAGLARVEMSINQPHELNTVLDEIVRLTTELLPATGGASITLWDVEQEDFVVSSSSVPDQPRDTTAQRVRKKGGATRWIVDHAKPFIVNDTSKDPFGANRMLDEYQLRAYAGFPLVTESGVLGVLYALDDHVRNYSQDDLAFLEALAARAALAVSRVRTFEALRHSHDLLAKRGKELEDFAHIVSHDLKAPLRGMLMLGKFLQQDFSETLGEAGRDMLEQLNVCGMNMGKLIDDILDYSRITHLEPVLEATELEPLVRRVLSLLPPSDHTVEVPETLPTVWAEPVRLLQVFQNLIGNAVKFMDKPQGRVTIACEEQEAHWLITVADNGPGIAPKHQAMIFEAFRGKVTESEVSGSGIGLAICRKVVEQHGGELSVESALGEGAAFRFTVQKPPA